MLHSNSSPQELPRKLPLSQSRSLPDVVPRRGRPLVIGVWVAIVAMLALLRTPFLSPGHIWRSDSLSSSSPASLTKQVVQSTHYTYDRSTALKLQTRVLAHSPGFTLLDNLFFFNNTMYLVTDDQTSLPPLERINFGDRTSMETHAEWIQSISTLDAQALFGSHVLRRSGVTLWVKDTFIGHIAHFMEMLLGAWKIYAVGVSPYGKDPLPLIDNLVFPYADEMSWRDQVQHNSFIVKAAFPSHSSTYANDLAERQSFGFVDVYDRVIVADRNSSSFSPENQAANKVCAGVVLLQSHSLFFEPLRQSILASLGDSPTLPPLRIGSNARQKIVITYISRQSGGQRTLREKDHDAIVAALNKLDDRFEINVVNLGAYSTANQIKLAARTNILLGLHGRGLTHFFWMQPGSLVIEMLYPGGWARDFELPARAVGHRHIAIHNDTTVRWEEMAPAMAIPLGFHGNDIPARPGPILDAIRAYVANEEFAAHGTRFADDGSLLQS